MPSPCKRRVSPAGARRLRRPGDESARAAPTARLEESSMMPGDPYERITPGMAVLDLAGDRIGSVRAVPSS